MEPAVTEILRAALQRAADAHGVYEAEQLGGVYDENWPEWYAAHMAESLAEEGYQLTRSAPQ